MKKPEAYFVHTRFNESFEFGFIKGMDENNSRKMQQNIKEKHEYLYKNIKTKKRP